MARHERRPVLVGCVALVLGLTLVPRRSRACKPRMPDPPQQLRGPSWDEGTSLELVDQVVELECDRGRRENVCRWRVLRVYEGSPGEAVSGRLALWGGSVADSDVRVLVDGEEMPSPAPLEDQGMFAWVWELSDDDAARVEVELSFDTELYTAELDGCALPAGYQRHRFVGRVSQDAHFMVEAAEQPGVSTHVRARAPVGWRIFRYDPTVDAGGSFAHRRSLDTSVDANAFSGLYLRNRPLLHGPLVAAGVGFGPQIRPRLRAGWEFAAPSFMLYSIAVEGDVREELLVVPTIEAALPSLWGVVPAPALGIGAPVLVLPEPRPGVRVQAALSFPVASLVGNVDVYPARQGMGRALRGSLMLQLSI